MDGASRRVAVSLFPIEVTIILAVADPTQLVRFYDDAYSQEPAQAAVYARWRALGAVGKADHAIALCTRAGLRPVSTLEVGCGDGALLTELHRRDFGGRLAGVEITQVAVAIARARPEIDSVELYDGLHLPVPDGAYELGILSHVLEHVHGDPRPSWPRSPARVRRCSSRCRSRPTCRRAAHPSAGTPPRQATSSASAATASG